MDVGIPDVGRDICVLPNEFPVVVDKTAVEPMFLPVVVETGPQVGRDPDLYCPSRMWSWILWIPDGISEICRTCFR